MGTYVAVRADAYETATALHRIDQDHVHDGVFWGKVKEVIQAGDNGEDPPRVESNQQTNFLVKYYSLQSKHSPLLKSLQFQIMNRQDIRIQFTLHWWFALRL